MTAAVPLNRLYVAPENARHGVPPQNVDELMANIAAYGVLQPLLVYEGDNGAYAVVGGARRLEALRRLRADGKIAKGVDWERIPVREIDPGDAAAASLAENTQRVDLGVVEAAEAWHRMTLDGRAISEIARAFGVTERFVKQRVRLAGLYEPILQALSADELSLDVAQLYAGAEISRQERVWKALGKQGRTPWRVKEELKKNTLRAGDPLARFVGEEAYLAAGGVVEHELFLAPEESRWLDPALAERLAKDKLAAAAAELASEGFQFVETAIELRYDAYVDGNFGKPRKPTPEEKERLAQIRAREKEIEREDRAIWKTVHEREDDHFADPNEEELARLDALEEERRDLATERQRLIAGQVSFDDKAKAKAGVVVTIDEDGALLIKRGVVAPKDRKATPAGKARRNASGKAASAKPAPPEPQAPMTNLTHEKTSRIASMIVGRTLARAPSVALVAITAAMARTIFALHDGSRCGEEILDMRFSEFEFGVDDAPSNAAHNVQGQRWSVALGKDHAKLEERMIEWPQNDVLDLLAFCVGACVKVIEPNAAREYDKHDARTRLALIGRLAGADPAAHFLPDAEYLNGYSRASLEAAASELGLDSAGLKTKAALAQAVADKAQEQAWTPPLLRTLCGVEVKSSKPAAKKKSAGGKGTAAKRANGSARAAVPTSKKRKAVRAKAAVKPKKTVNGKGARA